MACIVLSLAQLIVHESGHSCWYGEEAPKLLAYWFGRMVAKNHSPSLVDASIYCCVDEALEGGYDPDDYNGGRDSPYRDDNYYRLVPSRALGSAHSDVRMECRHQFND